MLIVVMMIVQGGGNPIESLKGMTSGFTDKLSNTRKSIEGFATPLLGSSDGLRSTASTQRIYRWTDKNGGIHFGTTRPDDDVTVKALMINPNSNVMDSYKSHENKQQTASVEPSQITSGGGFMPMSANPVKIKEMLEQAQKSNQARLQQIDAIQ